MRNVQNLRTAADRIRAATVSLTDPHDVAVVRHYLQELEEIARQQEAEVDRGHTLRLPLDAHVLLPGGDGEAETESSGTVVPLARTTIRGHLRKASLSEGRAGKWVLTLGDPNPG